MVDVLSIRGFVKKSLRDFYKKLFCGTGEYSRQEGSRSLGEASEITVAVLTAAQKTEIKRLTNIEFNYCDTNNHIEDKNTGCIYSDYACTNKVAEITISEYNDEGSFVGNYFNIRTGSITAGTYYWRHEPFASGQCSHAEGVGTTASGTGSHAEGSNTTASGNYSHAEGELVTASGNHSHAEGQYTIAFGNYSHVEGTYTVATGESSHAEGDWTDALGNYSHTEGRGTKADGQCSHAEGVSTTASGEHSHSEGQATIASGENSHAEGMYTIAASNYQHVSGKYNVSDANNTYGFIVGNGTGDNARSNAFAVSWDGSLNVWNSGSKVQLTPSKLSSLVSLQTITQSAYDALVQAGTVDANTIYIIT